MQDVENKHNNYREHDKANIELKIISARDDHFATINSILAELDEKS